MIHMMFPHTALKQQCNSSGGLEVMHYHEVRCLAHFILLNNTECVDVTDIDSQCVCLLWSIGTQGHIGTDCIDCWSWDMKCSGPSTTIPKWGHQIFGIVVDSPELVFFGGGAIHSFDNSGGNNPWMTQQNWLRDRDWRSQSFGCKTFLETLLNQNDQDVPLEWKVWY